MSQGRAPTAIPMPAETVSANISTLGSGRSRRSVPDEIIATSRASRADSAARSRPPPAHPQRCGALAPSAAPVTAATSRTYPPARSGFNDVSTPPASTSACVPSSPTCPDQRAQGSGRASRRSAPPECKHTSGGLHQARDEQQDSRAGKQHRADLEPDDLHARPCQCSDHRHGDQQRDGNPVVPGGDLRGCTTNDGGDDHQGGDSTGNVFGGVGLRELVLSATVQPETSKTGEASGACAFTRQPLSAGYSDSRAPARSNSWRSSTAPWYLPERMGLARCVLCVVSVAVEPTEQSPPRPATDSSVVPGSGGPSLHKSLPDMPTVQLRRGHVAALACARMGRDAGQATDWRGGSGLTSCRISGCASVRTGRTKRREP